MKINAQKYYLGMPCTVLAVLPNEDAVIRIEEERQTYGGSHLDPPEYEMTCQTLIVPSSMLSRSIDQLCEAEKEAAERSAENLRKMNEDISALRQERDRIKTEINQLNTLAAKNADKVQGIKDFIDLVTGNFTHVLMKRYYRDIEIVEKKDFVEKDFAKGKIKAMTYESSHSRQEKMHCVLAYDGDRSEIFPCSSYNDAIVRIADWLTKDRDCELVDSYIKYKKDLPNLSVISDRYEKKIEERRLRQTKDATAKRADLMRAMSQIENELKALEEKGKQP